jgi:hypothetical protein
MVLLHYRVVPGLDLTPTAAVPPAPTAAAVELPECPPASEPAGAQPAQAA